MASGRQWLLGMADKNSVKQSPSEWTRNQIFGLAGIHAEGRQVHVWDFEGTMENTQDWNKASNSSLTCEADDTVPAVY